jgi:hypothetical protein
MVPIQLRKEARRVPSYRECVQKPDAREERVVTGRQNRSQDHSVHDTPGGFCARQFEDEREGRRFDCAVVERGIVVGNVEADDQGG